MEYLIITEDAGFKHPVYGEGLLKKGKTYYTYSQFARETAERGLGRIVKEKKPCVIPFNQSHLGAGERFNKILLILAGGLGDAVTCGIVLPEVIKRYNIKIDICCDGVKWDNIFKPMGMPGIHIPYPPDIDTLAAYDAVLSDITRFYFSNKGLKSSPVIELLKGFGLETKDIRPGFQIPDETKKSLRLPPADAVRVGVNFDSNGLVKSYPEALHDSLLKGLKNLGFELFLFGAKKGADNSDSPGIHDFRSKTTILEMTALVEQMDCILGVDSFIVHLAGLLGVPSLVLLSTTTDSYFDWHKNISCISSKLGCAPCFAVFNQCPRGYPECHAFYHESIRPEIILRFVVKKVAALYSDIQTSC
ncbi:MAG: glycosyltransferase family 9 protein [Proteobacteria bacterium]|nr:glycosyltransferase family 9 protein [Pseudomonadota bacterium]